MTGIVIFDPDPVKARLVDQVAGLAKAEGAAEYAAARPDFRQTPAAFVIDASSRSGPNKTGTEFIVQDNRITFGVVLACQNVSDGRGEAAGKDMRALRLAVITALHGWLPGADFTPCEHVDGRLLQLNEFTMWWQENFATTTQLRSA